MSRNSLFNSFSGTLLCASLAPCVLFSVAAQAAEDENALALPATAIIEVADAQSQPDLHTPSTSGSRLNLSALETPASVTSISAKQILKRNNATVQDAVTRSPGVTFIGTPETAARRCRPAVSPGTARPCSCTTAPACMSVREP